MSSSSSFSAAAAEQRVRARRGGLPRPRRPSRPAPGMAGTPRLEGSGSAPWRVECGWWTPTGRAAAAAAATRVMQGNRELVRRALSPPARRGRGARELSRWSFRPAPSRLRNVSSFSPSPSAASPRPP